MEYNENAMLARYCISWTKQVGDQCHKRIVLQKLALFTISFWWHNPPSAFPRLNEMLDPEASSRLQ